ncbi:uncharacterized protein LOC118274036 [Spodoptera frugiperda]|uniref:Uncharacterized protein LOC118274036 n=1 Tax=Spodoptera frugiperda TaxID=7108 RepID=A0A9R0E9W0_SPOFR|nr:uncharacterized protein LOC118274036 [Spodoptera frugiperda]
MDIQAYFLLVILILIGHVSSASSVNSTKECPNIKTSLVSVRKRRHLAFPPGSAASITTSVVKTFMTHVPSGWFVVVEAELVYMLPDHTMISAHKRRKLHHRQKKEIWETLKDALEQRNMNGRACIIRTICEAKMRLAPKGKSLVHDILRAMFTAPLEEREFVEEMGLTYNELLEPDFCMKANDCPLSILSVILDLNRKR